MSAENETSRNARDSLNLKLTEPIVSTAQPWDDDVLDRQQLGTRLTSLIRTQSSPFTISIHGNWGTGKTFLLKRWQKDLEHERFKAIYFNAWEDDFCSDPLLAILGQMAGYFKESRLNTLTKSVIDVAIPLLRQNLLGVLHKSTGLTLDIDQTKQKSLVDEYIEQRATKDEVKQHLSRLSQAVVNETAHPLIFIIDELDRCRPTFAIELLERVKHIFDVQNIVFVFGINRDQLCVSLQSEYGHIDADTYLRRFFDIEFTLPDVDTEVYCKHVMDKFALNSFFSSLSNEANARVHVEEFKVLHESLPRIWARLGLSLRDIDYCVGSIAMVAKSLELRHYMFPVVLGVLIPLKLKNPELYRRFIQRRGPASEVIDYLDESFASQRFDDSRSISIDYVEASLYFAENANSFSTSGAPTSISQLELRAKALNLDAPEYLSKRLQKADPSRIQNILGIIRGLEGRLWPPPDDVIGYLVRLIDLHQSFIRR